MALHHQHKRKRISTRQEPYPHPNNLKRYIDYLVYGAAVVVPIMTVPQLIIIWNQKTAEGVSLITWSAYVAHSIIFFLYGLLHKEKPLMLMYGFQLIVNFFIVLGIIIYG